MSTDQIEKAKINETEMRDYSHLLIDPSDYNKYLYPGLLNRVIYILGNNKFCSYIARRLQKVITGIIQFADAKEKMDRQMRVKDNNTVEENAQEFSSGYGYADEAFELNVVLKYMQQIENGTTYENVESGAVYDEAIDALSTLLKEDKSIDTVFDFGICYAYIQSLLAKEFPNVLFSGIDRSKFTKTINKEVFSDYKNMEFIAGDVFEYLKGRQINNGVFFHMRTLTLLPEKFVTRIYKAAFDAGFKYIVGLEQYGISRATNIPYEYTNDYKASVPFRNGMSVHNYPGLITQANYTVLKTKSIKTNHISTDLRVLSILAKRK